MLRILTRPLPEGEEKTAPGTDLVSARRSSNSSHFDTACCSFHKQRTRPADTLRLRVEFGKRIVEMPAYFSKASFGCCYPDSVVVSVCLCPPLWDCPSVGDCRCRPFAQTCNLRSAPQSIPPTESFSTYP